MREKTILSENLKKLRKAHGLTQQQLANILKQKRSTYAYYENGVTPNPDTILKLAKIFDVSTHELVYGFMDEPSGNAFEQSDKSIFDSSFSTPDSTPPKIYYPSMSIDEKFLIHYMRLLPSSTQNKIMNEVYNLVSKNEEE